MNPSKFGRLGGVHLHHISFLSHEGQSSLLFKFQGSLPFLTLLPPLNSRPPFRCLSEEHCQIYLVWTQGGGRWLLNSWFRSPFSRRLFTGHYTRNASHIHQFHQGEERGLLSQLVSTAGQNVIKTLCYTRNLTGFKA